MLFTPPSTPPFFKFNVNLLILTVFIMLMFHVSSVYYVTFPLGGQERTCPTVVVLLSAYQNDCPNFDHVQR